MHGVVALGTVGLLPFSCLAARTAPYLGGRARRLEGAQQHGHCIVTQGATWSSLRPTARPHRLQYGVLRVQTPPLEIPWRWRRLDLF